MKYYLRIIKRMVSTNKKLLFATFLAILMSTLCEMMIPLGISRLISILELKPSVNIFVLGMLTFAFAYFLICVISALSTKLYIRIGSNLLWSMREQIYQVLWKANYFQHIQMCKDKFRFVLTDQTYTAFAIAVIYTISGFANLVTIISFLSISFFYSLKIGALLIISIAVTLLVSFFTGKSVLSGFELTNTYHELDSAQIYETIDLTELARTNGLQTYFINKNKQIHDEFMDVTQKSESKSAFCETLENSLHSMIYIFIAGILLLEKNVDGSKIITILFLTNISLDISQRLQRQLQVIIKNIPSFSNVIELIETPLEGGDDISHIENILIDKVSLTIDNRVIFQNVSANINSGDNVLIKGDNGSGKSSLLKMLVGLYSPTGGRIYINEKDIHLYNYSSFYKEICYISQDELMLSETLQDYLSFITHSNIDELTLSNIKNTVRFNNEIERIEENGITLSGGEKKKILIMKYLLSSKVSMVITDEIDSGLDADTKDIWEKMENTLKNDKKIIFIKISHIDSSEIDFDHIITL